jgi:hypothetical protein
VWANFLRENVEFAGSGGWAFSLALLLRSISVARSKAAAAMPGYIAQAGR